MAKTAPTRRRRPSRALRRRVVCTTLLVVIFTVLILPVAPAAPARASPSTWRWPLDGRPRILRRFTPPPEPWLAGHRGIDLAAPAAAPVLAAGPGTIRFAGPVGGKGVVTIDHEDGLRTTYQPVTASVRSGQPVTSGAKLGVLESTTSHCEESCLHWGLRRGTSYLNPLQLLGHAPTRLLPFWALTAATPATNSATRTPSISTNNPTVAGRTESGTTHNSSAGPTHTPPPIPAPTPPSPINGTTTGCTASGNAPSLTTALAIPLRTAASAPAPEIALRSSSSNCPTPAPRSCANPLQRPETAQAHWARTVQALRQGATPSIATAAICLGVITTACLLITALRRGPRRHPPRRSSHTRVRSQGQHRKRRRHDQAGNHQPPTQPKPR